jgi:uncharacterized protein (DUF1810 family)
MTSRLERFLRAQDEPDVGFESALKELATTGKRGHWIWYVFPQLYGLGSSPQSRLYGIRGRAEASEYLRDPVLRARLIVVMGVVAKQLQGGMPLSQLMGSDIDALKLVSSLTLFEAVSRSAGAGAQAPMDKEFADRAAQVLAATEAQGYARCEHSLRLLGE